jgi:hypothetical protein
VHLPYRGRISVRWSPEKPLGMTAYAQQWPIWNVDGLGQPWQNRIKADTGTLILKGRLEQRTQLGVVPDLDDCGVKMTGNETTLACQGVLPCKVMLCR